MAGPEIELPFNFTPRDYQVPIWEAFDRGLRRFIWVAHRRAGKDKNCFNLLARATQLRVGTYFYFLPTFTQARRVIWNGMDYNGFRFINHIPRDLWDGKPNETDMRIRLKNGSVFQLVGSDNIDNIVGTNPIGCVFSEFSLQDPAGWDFIRPILRENDGWAMFNGTPRGKANHLYRMYQMAKDNDDWFAMRQGIDDTGVLNDDDIQAERDAGMSEELIQQEFYCSFEGGLEGAIYVNQMNKARADGRVCKVPHNEEHVVHTAWDMGMDKTAIIFFQLPPNGTVNIIDYHESTSEPLSYYVTVLRDKTAEFGYVYKDHIAPWDVVKREYGEGRSRLKQAAQLGLVFKKTPKLSIDDGVNAVQMMLARCMFDAERCDRLVEALYAYRRKQDRVTKEYLATPVHNWASHPADAMRVLALGRRNASYDEAAPERYTTKQRSSRFNGTSWMSA